MGFKVRLTNKSQVTDPLVESSTQDGTPLLFSRAIYQRLGSLEHCKHILEDYNNNKLPGEFKDFLDAMNVLFTDVDNATSTIKNTDEYLGSLGVTEHYPYSKDSISVAPWIGANLDNQFRVLSGNDEEYILTDENGVALISYYNIQE